MFTLQNIRYKEILKIEALHIPANKVTFLVGESGAGKSTLLKMLNIMLTPDHGEIFYKKENIDDLDPIYHRRNVTMLSQQPTIFEGTIRENLNIGLIFSGEKEKEDNELEQALTIVHLEKGLDEQADTLSGGEKQRLALARILLLDAEVYLLDEPTSALDEATEEIVMKNFIEIIKKKNKTAIFITHSKKLVSTYAENLVTLKKYGGEV
jgi:putative ABC transport system ATP-binding protein